MISYETFNPKLHDLNKVAKLIYDVDFRTFDIFYKNENDAVSDIRKTLKKDENLKVILDADKNIIGILLFHVSKPSFKFTFKPLKLFLVDVLDYFVLCDIEDGDFYIADIAIDESLRGNGLGRKVLNDVIAYSKNHNLKRVILDADFRNAGARKLYESLGFKVYNKKQVKIGSFQRGMYNMELILGV